RWVGSDLRVLAPARPRRAAVRDRRGLQALRGGRDLPRRRVPPAARRRGRRRPRRRARGRGRRRGGRGARRRAARAARGRHRARAAGGPPECSPGRERTDTGFSSGWRSAVSLAFDMCACLGLRNAAGEPALVAPPVTDAGAAGGIDGGPPTGCYALASPNIIYM